MRVPHLWLIHNIQLFFDLITLSTYLLEGLGTFEKCATDNDRVCTYPIGMRNNFKSLFQAQYLYNSFVFPNPT